MSESPVRRHRVAIYGDPTVWPYHFCIDGGYDKSGKPVQFAPKLKSSGGAFDPREWAQLAADAGARFAGPVSAHHDGFAMWDSRVNEWNSVAKGPGQLQVPGLYGWSGSDRLGCMAEQARAS